MTGQFDRVRPRILDPVGSGASIGQVGDTKVGGRRHAGSRGAADEPSMGQPVSEAQSSIDVDGRSALFSRSPLPVRWGTLALTCSSCRTRTIVGYVHAVRLAIPSLHLPLLRRDYFSWMLCPACQRRTWLRIELR